MPRVVSKSQIKAGQIVILSDYSDMKSLLSWKLKLAVARGVHPSKTSMAAPLYAAI